MTLQVPSITQSKEGFGIQAWFQRIVRAVNNNTPVGVLLAYAGSIAPTGWVLCDGSAISRTTYVELFSIIGETFGVGDGLTTFNLPDLKGRTIFGKDNMGGSAANRVTNAGSGIDATTLGASGGNEFMQRHAHPQAATTKLAGVSTPGYDAGLGNASSGGTTQNQGLGDSENMPPAIILNYIIKY